jgi:hypothetical protein
MYRWYFFLKLNILNEYLIQHYLKLGGTNYHFKWVTVPGTTPYRKEWLSNLRFLTLFRFFMYVHVDIVLNGKTPLSAFFSSLQA